MLYNILLKKNNTNICEITIQAFSDRVDYELFEQYCDYRTNTLARRGIKLYRI